MTPYDRARQLLTQLSAAVGKLENDRAELARQPDAENQIFAPADVDLFTEEMSDDLKRWLDAANRDTYKRLQP